MSRWKLHDILSEADKSGVALGHFNVSDSVALNAVFAAARDRNLPVVIGLSEGERSFMGVQLAAAAVRSLREEHGYPIFLNADHTHSLAGAVTAVQAGFDSVVFDRSELPIEQNIAETREAVLRLKEINPDVIVEGEIGNIGTGSEIHDRSPEALDISNPEEARRFVEATGVDVLAPAVGNMHGLLKTMVSGSEHKHLRLDVIRAIKAATGTFLTLHGGSGTDDADLQEGIRAGITQIHINTEIRLAWRRGTEAGLSQHPDEVAPYKILASTVEAIKKTAGERLDLFQSRRRAAQTT